MPAVEALLDSNVLVYALPRAPEEPAKQARARELIATTQFGLSFQVFQEVFVTATRKLAVPLAPAAALRFLQPFLVFPFAGGTIGLFHDAARLSVRFQIHYYDAAILAAARELGAAVVYSEDMAHGQDYDGVKVINPFHGLAPVAAP
jgi:predicted nucleic acid-binding protein